MKIMAMNPSSHSFLRWLQGSGPGPALIEQAQGDLDRLAELLDEKVDELCSDLDSNPDDWVAENRGLEELSQPINSADLNEIDSHVVAKALLAERIVFEITIEEVQTFLADQGEPPLTVDEIDNLEIGFWEGVDSYDVIGQAIDYLREPQKT